MKIKKKKEQKEQNEENYDYKYHCTPKQNPKKPKLPINEFGNVVELPTPNLGNLLKNVNKIIPKVSPIVLFTNKKFEY